MSDTTPSEAERIAETDPSVERVVTDRSGLEKPHTHSGTVDTDDRFCELCTYAQTAQYLAIDYREGTPVCTTHARALATGDWNGTDTTYTVVDLPRGADL